MVETDSSALVLAAHPPGRGSGSSMRGLVTIQALRSLFKRVDAVAFTHPSEEAYSDRGVTLIPRPPQASAIAQLAALFHGGAFYTPERRAVLMARIRELIETGRLLPNYGLVWAHSSLMARAASCVEATARILDIDNVAGADARGWVNDPRASSPKRLYRWINAAVLAREERGRCQSFDGIVVTSRLERERLGEVRPPVVVIPNTVNGPDILIDPKTAPPRLLFIGSLDYWPNIDAVDVLVREIMPRIRTNNPEASLTIAGRNPPDSITNLCAAARVTLVPNAPSLDSLYASARVVVAPMRFGGGTRLKLIEAMAHGLPIVATPAAAEGIVVEDGMDVLLAAEPTLFAERCSSLLADPFLAGRLGKAARNTWSRAYRPEVATRKIAALVERLCP